MRTLERYKFAIGFTLAVMFSIVVIIWAVKHDEGECRDRGGHMKWQIYGKYVSGLCLTEDGRVIE